MKPQLVIPEISLQLLKFWAASNLDVLHTHFNWRYTLPLCIVQYVFKVKLHMCGRLTVIVLIIIVLVISTRKLIIVLLQLSQGLVIVLVTQISNIFVTYKLIVSVST